MNFQKRSRECLRTSVKFHEYSFFYVRSSSYQINLFILIFKVMLSNRHIVEKKVKNNKPAFRAAAAASSANREK